MTPEITVHVDTDPDDDDRILHVWYSADIEPEPIEPHDFPVCVLQALDAARDAFLVGGLPLNLRRVREDLKHRLQRVIDYHTELGDLEYSHKFGFVRKVEERLRPVGSN